MQLQWIDFWRKERVTLTFSQDLGFGLRACAHVNRGTRVLSGVVGNDAADKWALVEPYGALFGPASLVNAACDSHANVAFEQEKKDNNIVWVLIVTRTLRVGDAVLANYPVEKCGCCVEGCRQPLVQH